MGEDGQSAVRSPLPPALLDALNQAIIEISPDGRIVGWNAAAESMFGRRGADVLGRPLDDLGMLAAQPGGWPALAAQLAAGAPVGHECEAIRGEGSTFCAVVLDVPVPGESGSPARIFRLVTDLNAQPSAPSHACELRDARWHALVSRSADLAAIAEPVEQRLTWASPAASRLFGWRPQELVGQLGRTFVHPDDADCVAEALALVKADPSLHPTIEFRLRCADGSYRWVEETLTNLIDEPGVHGLVANIRDIQDRRLAEDALRASEARFRLIAETAQEGIWAVDTAGRTMYANKKLSELLGYPLDAVYAMHEFDVAEGESRAEFLRRTGGRQERGAECYEMPHVRPDGSHVVLRISASPLYEDGRYLGSLAMVADVTAAREAERELHRRATHDSLTGLPNRPSLLEKLQLAIDGTVGFRGRSLAVLVADIDQFKLVNDTLGHAAGDELLIEVSRRWEAVLRPTDVLARFGGDEFVVLCPGAQVEQAQRIAARLQRALQRPIQVTGRTVAINASIGIAVLCGGRLTGAPPQNRSPTRGPCSASPTPRCTPRRPTGPATQGSSAPRSSAVRAAGSG